MRNFPLVPYPRSMHASGSYFYASVLELSCHADFLAHLRALRDEMETVFGASILAPASAREEFAFFQAQGDEAHDLWGANFRQGYAPSLTVRLEKLDTPEAPAGASAETTASSSIQRRADLGYSLDLSAAGILLKASHSEGAAAACATLMQLLHLAWEGWRFKLPALSIQDEPTLEWRGLMLDSARHFIPVATLKRIFSLAWLYKINRLHWHLTDDQGWRIELLNTPSAVESGSTRPGGDPYRNGYYTQDEIRELIDYATDRGITVVPELDLPGHVQAVLAGNPDLACTAGPHNVWTSWGISEEVLCMGNPASVDFALTAWDEVCSLFPGPYVHIGGDECPTLRWEACPRCAAKKKELGLREWKDLQGYFMDLVTAHLKAKGKIVFGWDEILDTDAKDTNIVHWRDNLADQGRIALDAGLDLICSPTIPYYLNFVQTDDRTRTPGPAYMVKEASTLQRVYEHDPFRGYESMDFALKNEDPRSEKGTKGRYLGIQGNTWSEYIRDPRRLEYMLFPRLLAICETAWNGPYRKSYENFYDRLVSGHCGGGGSILSRLGVNFCSVEFNPES